MPRSTGGRRGGAGLLTVDAPGAAGYVAAHGRNGADPSALPLTAVLQQCRSEGDVAAGALPISNRNFSG